ncbi:hypothetical protein ACP9OK_19285 [Pseudomonas sp. B11]
MPDHHREGGVDPEVEEFHGIAEDHREHAALASRCIRRWRIMG